MPCTDIDGIFQQSTHQCVIAMSCMEISRHKGCHVHFLSTIDLYPLLRNYDVWGVKCTLIRKRGAREMAT